MLQLRENSCNEVKALIREVLERLVPPLLATAGMDPQDIASLLQQQGGKQQKGGGEHLVALLQMLPHAGFMQVGGWAVQTGAGVVRGVYTMHCGDEDGTQ